MKLILVALIGSGLWLSNAALAVRAADKDEGSPGWNKNGHVPPGLAKKGGVPPGQAKKHGNKSESEETEVAKPASPAAAPAPAPAPTSTPPATAPKPPEATTPAPAPATKPAETAKTPPAAPQTGKEKREALDRKVKELNVLGSNPTERSAVLRQTSKALDVPIATLQNQQKNHPELRPGGLYMANAIAKKAKKPAGQIIKRHLDDKKDWGEIAKENNVNLDRLLEETTALEKTVRG